jgi:hypothetical protein
VKKETHIYLEKNANNPEALKKFSRRELMGVGLLGLASRIWMPSTATLLAGMLEAKAETAVSWMPFMTFNLSGGAAIHGNIAPLNSGGGLLPTYDLLGLGKRPTITPYLGLNFSDKSRLLEGLKSVLSPEAAAKAKGTILCTTTAADTNAIPPLRSQFDLSPVLEKTGKKGEFFSDLQMNASNTSIRSFHDQEPVSRISVASLNQLKDSLSLTAVYSSAVSGSDATPRFTQNQKRSVASVLSKMTEIQMNARESSKAIAEKEKLIDASKKIEDLVGGSVSGRDLVDPYKSTHATSVYQLTDSARDAAATQTTAAIAYCNLMGYSSHSFIALPAYDYHEPASRLQSNQKDFEAGVQIGRVLELAHRLNKPVFIFVTTDGSCVSYRSDDQTAQWSGDTTTSLQVIFAYHPNGIDFSTSGTLQSQIGNYNNDQSSNKNTLVGDRTDYVASAVTANYLALHNQLNRLSEVVPSTITQDRTAEVVRFKVKG